MPGVVAVTSWTWFGGVFEEEEGVTFPNFAVEPDAIGEIWPDCEHRSAEQLEEFKRHRDARDRRRRARSTKYGWKVGDHVTLKGTVFPVDLDVPDRRRDPERARAALLVPARVPRAGAARRRAATFDFARHDLGARRRSRARRAADARDRRDVPQQRGRRPPPRPRRATSRTSSARSRASCSLILLVTGAGRAVHRVHRREHREHGRARAHAARSRC